MKHLIRVTMAVALTVLAGHGFASTNTMLFAGGRIKTLSEAEIAARKWGPRSQGFQLSIAADKEVYQVGEHIVLSVLLRNVSQRPLHYWNSHGKSDFQIDLLTADGGAVPLTDDGQQWQGTNTFAYSASRVDLRPNDTIEHSIQLDKLYRIDRVGKYAVTVKRLVPEEDGSPHVKALQSDTVHITVQSR